MQQGKDLLKQISKKSFKKAVSYYAKVAHRQGGDFVLNALGYPMKYSVYGSVFSIVKSNFVRVKAILFEVNP